LKTLYRSSFFRDAKKCPPSIRKLLLEILENVEQAKAIREIPDIKKLKGHKTAYRIKLNDYRIYFYYEDDIITIARFLPRKDVYRFFP